jgi:hypothetical protein
MAFGICPALYKTAERTSTITTFCGLAANASVDVKFSTALAAGDATELPDELLAVLLLPHPKSRAVPIVAVVNAKVVNRFLTFISILLLFFY